MGSKISLIHGKKDKYNASETLPTHTVIIHHICEFEYKWCIMNVSNSLLTVPVTQLMQDEQKQKSLQKVYVNLVASIEQNTSPMCCKTLCGPVRKKTRKKSRKKRKKRTLFKPTLFIIEEGVYYA